MGLLDGKVAIVTGAGHGIGRGEALELAAQGAKVVVNDLGVAIDGEGSDKRPAEEVVEIIRSRGGEAVPNYDDVGDWGGAENIVNSRARRVSARSTSSSTTPASCATRRS